MSITIYGIQCKINNKIYIGQTTNYKNRIKNHIMELNGNRHCNKYLQEDYNNYGKNNFIFFILEDDVDYSLRLYKETYYMNLYGGTNSNNIYNVKGNFNDDNKDYAMSKTRHFRGKFDLFRGHKHSDKSKSKISKSLKEAYKHGKHKLPEKKFGKENSFYGKHHTATTKEILSKARTKYDDKFISELRDLRNTGMQIKDIANRYNMNTHVVGSLIKYGTSSRKVINKIRKSQNKV